MYTVYMHTAPNRKRYIGITSNEPKIRWNCGHGYKCNYYFSNAIKKYGWNNIKHEILIENLTKEQAEQKEIELIAEYKSNQREYGYNIDNGGNSNGKHSEETKKKLSEAFKGEKNYWYGKHLPKEICKKISESQKGEKAYWYGKQFPKEIRKKMSESQKGEKNHNFGRKGEQACWYGKHHSEETKRKISEANTGDKHYFYGKHHSEETKTKMSEARKGEKSYWYGKHLSKETKEKLSKINSIQVICIETNIYYPSAKIAGETLNICPSNITKVCNGKRKTTGGYHFKYAS